MNHLRLVQADHAWIEIDILDDLLHNANTGTNIHHLANHSYVSGKGFAGQRNASATSPYLLVFLFDNPFFKGVIDGLCMITSDSYSSAAS